MSAELRAEEKAEAKREREAKKRKPNLPLEAAMEDFERERVRQRQAGLGGEAAELPSSGEEYTLSNASKKAFEVTKAQYTIQKTPQERKEEKEENVLK